MTRAQAEELLALGRAEIAKWVERLTPVAGENASIEDGAVSLMKPPVFVPASVPEPTWEWKLFASVQGQVTGVGEPVEIDIENELAARVVRSTLGLLLTNFWQGGTQLLSTQPEEGPPVTRSYELTLTARAIKPTETVDVESGFTPPDFRLTLEEYDSSNDPTAGEVIDTYNLTLRSGSVSRSFTQRNPGRITSLRLVAVKSI